MTELVFDLHATPKEHHFEACQNYVTWEQSRPTESLTTVYMGDVFDEPENQGQVTALVTRLIEARRRHGPQLCIRGNHDYTKSEGSAIDLLKELEVEVIDFPCVKKIDGTTYLILPYLWPRTWIGENIFTNMDEIYSDPGKLEMFTGPLKEGATSDSPWVFDAILGHVGDETAGEYAANCNLSWFKGPIYLGHIHKPVSPHFPGATRVTRWDERGKKNVFVRVTEGPKFKELPIPSFLDYADLAYGEPARLDEGHTVWVNNVRDCPDPATAREEYKRKFPTARWRNFDKKLEEASDVHLPAEAGKPQKHSSAYLLELFGKTGKVSAKAFGLMRKTLVK